MTNSRGGWIRLKAVLKPPSIGRVGHGMASSGVDLALHPVLGISFFIGMFDVFSGGERSGRVETRVVPPLVSLTSIAVPS